MCVLWSPKALGRTVGSRTDRGPNLWVRVLTPHSDRMLVQIQKAKHMKHLNKQLEQATEKIQELMKMLKLVVIPLLTEAQLEIL